MSNVETSSIVSDVESNVRSYCRSFPQVFERAEGCFLFGRDGTPYLDFFSGAGVMNYGHNNPVLKTALLDYIGNDGITHGLDMTTVAKEAFLESFSGRILEPRGLDYRMMFPGPTGTNAVESALKLARKVTGRTEVIAFTRGFHGMTLGSLAATGNGQKRGGAGIPLAHVTHMPFEGFHGPDVSTLEVIDSMLSDPSSGVNEPAAILLETVQAEGGINVASTDWLQGVERLACKHRALLIVDDVQVGCGRTGPFFSFERAGLEPDIVCLSKSLSGFGLPLALTLIREELDIWEPGEHNGTFRGNNHAFVTAHSALETYWRNDDFTQHVDEMSAQLGGDLRELADEFGATARGRGLIQGLAFEDPEVASHLSRLAFERELLIETSGPSDEVLKFLPALTITADDLTRGVGIVRACLEEYFEDLGAATGAAAGEAVA